MKKKAIIIVSVAVALVVIGVCAWQFIIKGMLAPNTEAGSAVYVESVSKIIRAGSLGLQNRYSGTVEPQKELKVKKDADKKVAKLNVTEGQTVKAGDVLFIYDTDEIALSLEQARLELEGIDNAISALYNNIEELTKQKNDASSDQQLDFTVQIQSAQLDVKNKEYEKTTKNNEIAKLEKAYNNAEVKSEIDGVVKSVNDSQEQSDKPYISILSTGNFRVKSVVSETNINALTVGQAVIVRSRIDDTAVWKGKIESIDKENAVSENQNGGMVIMGDGSNTTNKASKYNFYITLESYDNLILGQHVYVELDMGQETKKEGLWIPSYYIADLENPYVWAKSGGDKLEKRTVTLGERDDNTGMVQIASGLTEDDSIAYPQEAFTEGLPTTNEMVTEQTGKMGGVVDGGTADSGEDSVDGGEVTGGDGEAAADGGVIGGSDGANAVGGAEVAVG